MYKSVLSLLMLLFALSLPITSVASELTQSAKTEKTILKQAQQSQKVVDKSANKSLLLENEIDALQAEIDNLSVYEKHLTGLVVSQRDELAALHSQLDEISETRQSIIPLMYEMLDGLAVYINQDMPIRQQTRLNRVNKLQQLMTESGVSDAEKFRRILEAYQIELDYVNKLGTYTSTIEINGAQRQVEQLYLGNVSFIARSSDAQQYWLWSQDQQNWRTLPAELNQELDKAYLSATKVAAPSLLMLPISLDKEVK